MDKMRTLETVHKSSLAAKAFHELTQAQLDLQDILGLGIRRQLLLSQKLFYKFGNKSRKLLARTLNSKQALIRVHSFKDSKGVAQPGPAVIAGEFQKYYSRLYNLSPVEGGGCLNTPCASLIQDFQLKYCPPPLSTEDMSSLDGPLTKLEFEQALKQTKPGKSPDRAASRPNTAKLPHTTLPQSF